MRTKLLLLFSIVLTFQAAAQEDGNIGAIITDRPDATESPSLVRKNFLQIETGGFYTQDDDNGLETRELTFNTTLLRYGLLDNFELRLGLDTRQTEISSRFTEDEIELSGTSPLLIGAKIGIAEGDGWSPRIAILGHLTMPFTASSDYKTENTGMDFRLSFDHSINDWSGLAYNIGARLDAGNPELQYIYTIAYGFDITGPFGAYVELYGDFPEDSSANHLWDAGFTYLANNDLQFDITVGSGINTSQQILLSAGLSYRIRNIWN